MERKPIIALIHLLRGSLPRSFLHSLGVFEHPCWGQPCRTTRATKAALAQGLQMTPAAMVPKVPASCFLIFLFPDSARHPCRLGSARESIFQGSRQETSKMASKFPSNHRSPCFQRRPETSGRKQQTDKYRSSCFTDAQATSNHTLSKPRLGQMPHQDSCTFWRDRIHLCLNSLFRGLPLSNMTQVPRGRNWYLAKCLGARKVL